MEDEVLEFIQSYTARHGYPPTYREIGAACGISSTSQVSSLLEKLEGEGRLDKKSRSARTVRVLE